MADEREDFLPKETPESTQDFAFYKVLAQASKALADAERNYVAILRTGCQAVTDWLGAPCVVREPSHDGRALIPIAADTGTDLRQAVSLPLDRKNGASRAFFQEEGASSPMVRENEVVHLLLAARSKRQGLLSISLGAMDPEVFKRKEPVLLELTERIAIAMDNAKTLETAEKAIHSNPPTEWSALQLKSITDIIPMLVTYIDRDLIYRFNNRYYDEWFGIPYQSIRGKYVREVLGEEGFAICKPYFDRVFRGESVVFERKMMHPKKGIRTVRIYYAPDISTSGAIQGVVAAVRDVTEERELTDQLQRAIRVRDEFLTIAAHELRTPVTVLKLQNQTLAMMSKRDGGLAQVPAETLQKLLATSERQISILMKLVEDLLDVSKISRGRFHLEPKKVDLAKLVQEAVDQFEYQLTTHGCEILLERVESVVGFWDPIRLSQVISNLISNAIKYGAGRPIRIRDFARDGEAILEIQDSGIGIASDKIDLIFDRFERAIDHRNISGLGLGLYIVRQIVEAHRGSVEVESELGRGSTFRVRLPLGSQASS